MESVETTNSSSDGVAGHIRVPNECTNLTDKVHLLPCSIKYNGPCDVSAYFKPKPSGTIIDDLEVKYASFRGRKLAGATMRIPEGYQEEKRKGKKMKIQVFVLKGSYDIRPLTIKLQFPGLILRKLEAKNGSISDKDPTPVAERNSTWIATSSFNNMTYWNHDTLPSETDTLNSCFHWFAVSNAINKPVMADELESELEAIHVRNGPTCGQKRKQVGRHTTDR